MQRAFARAYGFRELFSSSEFKSAKRADYIQSLNKAIEALNRALDIHVFKLRTSCFLPYYICKTLVGGLARHSSP